MGFDWKKFKDGERFKFVKPEDHIEGTITRLSVTDFGGQADATPVLDIKTDTGTIVSVTASQTVLCSRLAEEAPDVGDFISITYTGDADNARPGRSPAKLFDVIVKRAGTGAPTPPPTTTPPDPANEPF